MNKLHKGTVKNNMKRNIIMVIMFLALLPVLVAGYTQAIAVFPPGGWFTDEDSTPTNTFTAGTLLVSADGNIDYSGDCNDVSADCSVVSLEIENTGSKSAYVRAFLEGTWSITSYTNTAIATANATVDGNNISFVLSDSAIYIEGGIGSSGGSGSSGAPGTFGTKWFTDYDGIDPLFIENESGAGTPGEGGDSPDYPFPIGKQELGPPTVDGLFYAKVDNDFKIDDPEYINKNTGISDSQRYELYAISALGSKIYTYLDEGEGILYVATVVSRNVNDNVFDKSNESLYMNSAGWKSGGNRRPLFHLVNSEEMGFSLSLGEGCTYSWIQGYAGWDSSTNEWVSNNASGVPTFETASSIVWNLNNSVAWDSDSTEDNKYNKVVGPIENDDTFNRWKSPFDDEDDVRNMVDGSYPHDVTQPITFSYDYKWEWPMVYEFSIRLSDLECSGIENLSLGSTYVHHSPRKDGGPEYEYFYQLTFKKEVSFDGGYSYQRANNNALVFNQEDKLYYRFVVTNPLHGSDLVLDSLVIYDDVIGSIFSGSITIPAKGSKEFYYPNDGSNSEEFAQWTEDSWISYYNSLNGTSISGDVSFTQCGDSAVLWQYQYPYYYFKKPLQSGEPAILNAKACPVGLDPALAKYANITINSYAEAIQTSHEAALEEWSMGYFNGHYKKIDGKYEWFPVGSGEEKWVPVVGSSQLGNYIIIDGGSYSLILDGSNTFRWGKVLPLENSALNKNGITNFKGWIIQE